jgi:hypothetical protein
MTTKPPLQKIVKGIVRAEEEINTNMKIQHRLNPPRLVDKQMRSKGG